MENPALDSVLAGGPGEGNFADSNDKVKIAPGVAPSERIGLSRGAQRMELETWKEGITALKGLLGSLDASASQNGHNGKEHDSTDGAER